VYAEAPELGEVTSSIRFGCNHRTTQEGRLAKRGARYEIRINFCLRHGRSRLVSETEYWLKWVRMCGGRVSVEEKAVLWNETAAKRYAAFLLLHELAHIAYFLRHSGHDLVARKGGREEERFCDEWAAQSLARFWDG
jgi:hypothetical protein